MTVEVERPERSIGAAAVTGAVKGAVAGVLLTASALLLARLVVGRGLTVTSAELAVVASIVGGGALAGASFCGLDAAAARVTNKLAALGLRIAAGLVAPIAAASPWYGLGGGAFESALSTRELQAFGMFALSLAAGQVAAGHPDELPHEPQGCGRLARAGMAAPLAFVLAMFLARAHGDICGEGFSASLGGLVCAGAFWVAQAAAAPVARRVARLLEPELMADLEPSGCVRDDLVAATRALEEAAATSEPERAAALRADARTALDRADAHLGGPATYERQMIALRLAEVFLAGGDTTRAEALAEKTGFAPLIRAEAARLRGEIERSESTTQAWHDAYPASNRSYRARSARANALLFLARLRADQGRIDEATRLVAAAANECSASTTIFHHLTLDRVRAYIQACTDRSRPA